MTLRDRIHTEILLHLRDDVYGGSWMAIVQDLKARLKMRPLMENLKVRMEADLVLIEKL